MTVAELMSQQLGEQEELITKVTAGRFKAVLLDKSDKSGSV